MNGWFYFLIAIALLLWLIFTIIGFNLCSKNNAIGIVILFITMNILGLLFGIAIFYNNKNKVVQVQKTIIKEFENNVSV